MMRGIGVAATFYSLVETAKLCGIPAAASRAEDTIASR